MHDRKDYRLEAKPVGKGGQAEVFPGVRKSDGLSIAFKRRTSDGLEARTRMRREIEIQTKLVHEHVMPVLDWDEAYEWYVMPLGTRTVDELPTPIDDVMLLNVVQAVLRAFEVAHAADHPHRDVKPSNIVELVEEGRARWVLADWGLTRRALGQTTTGLTVVGRFVGTEGYAPPESYTDPHAVGPKGDLYALGQCIGWAKSGMDPVPNIPAAAPEPWRRLSKVLTRHLPDDRPASASDVLSMLPNLGAPKTATSTLTSLLQRGRGGDPDAAVAACLQAADRPEDTDLLLDEVPRLPNVATPLVQNHPEETLRLAKAIAAALDFGTFGRRDFDHANVPLRWMLDLARAAAAAGKNDLLEDLCDTLFPVEAGWDRYPQRDRTVDWVCALREPAASVVAGCLRTHPAMRTYLAGRVDDAKSASIRDAMRDE